MHINKVRIRNFQLLRDRTLDLRKELSLLVGMGRPDTIYFIYN